MKRLIPKQKVLIFNNSIDYLLKKTKKWSFELNFIKVEQKFLKELLAEHVIEFCKTNNFKKAKLFLSGLEQESKLGDELIKNIDEHTINLALLVENIYLKREDNFRKNHEYLKIEVIKYIENFKYLKEQVFDLVLFIMKKEKQHKLLTK